MNVAPRMVPSGKSGSWSKPAMVAIWLCRVISLGLTVLITLGACLIAMIAFGGQCGVGWPTTGRCPIGVEAVGRWFGPDFDIQRLTGVTFLPVLAILLIWGIAGRTQTKKGDDDRKAVRGWQQERKLQDGRFWQQQIGEQRLRAIHLQAAFITMPMAFAVSLEPSAWTVGFASFAVWHCCGGDGCSVVVNSSNDLPPVVQFSTNGWAGSRFSVLSC